MISKPMIVELDFGMGNIRSLEKAFEHLGANIQVTDDIHLAQKADALLLPGDGAFARAMTEITRLKMKDLIIDFVNRQKPVLGICIGFQILFEHSEEFGNSDGFGFLPGTLTRFDDKKVIVPHMGWSKIKILRQTSLTQGFADEEFFYFVHSFRYQGISEFTIAVDEYDGEFSAIIEKGNLFGTQFHPEKSHDKGLRLLKNFMEIVEQS